MTVAMPSSERRPRCPNGALFGFSVAVLLLGGSVAWAQTDRIYPPTGSPTVGQVTKITPAAVTISVAGAERDIPVDQIRRLTFTGDPPELERARDLVADERYEDALKELTAITATGLTKPVEQDIAFYKADADARLALDGRGDPAKAAAGIGAFLASSTDSYHYFPAKELFAELAIAAGRFPSAEAQFAELVAAPFTSMKIRAKLRQADAQRYGGKPADAITNYDAVLSVRGTGPEIERAKQLAQIGKAASMAESGKADEALTALRELVKTNDSTDQELFGRIYNAMGDAYLVKKDTQQALLSYLKTPPALLQRPRRPFGGPVPPDQPVERAGSDGAFQ